MPKIQNDFNRMLNSEVMRISQLMEDVPPSGGTSHMSGASTAQIPMMVQPDVTTLVSEPRGYGETQEDQPEFTELELKIATRFIELVGGAEKARDLINKCDECQECLGLVADDGESIENIANIIPSNSDLPTPRGADMSSLYNPSAISY